MAASLAAAAYVPTQRVQALEVPERYQSVILAVGWQPADIPTLVDVITCESSWNALAVGDGGHALGLMQIWPGTWEHAQELDDGVPGVESWSNPAANLYTGRVLHDESGWRGWTCAR